MQRHISKRFWHYRKYQNQGDYKFFEWVIKDMNGRAKVLLWPLKHQTDELRNENKEFKRRLQSENIWIDYEGDSNMD